MDSDSFPTAAAAEDPYALFDRWMAEATAAEPNDPNAAALATVSADGAPSVRVVLLKTVDSRGFAFFTNLDSHKGRDLQANPRAALNLHWKSLGRQVRIEGRVEQVSDAEADAYYATRPRGSRIGAWASKQSRPLDDRATLEGRVADFDGRFGGDDIPRPDFWSGFRVVPEKIEFWQGRQSRLHDRLVFRREKDGWTTQLLYP
ncbi:MAG: pyridoxamine 5'-phosphate oxidase [Pseudomonadota bacterium]